MKAGGKVTQTLNPFKVKLEKIKDVYRKYPRTDSSGNIWATNSDYSENQPLSDKPKDQEGESSPTDLPKPSKEDIQRKIQEQIHSGTD